MRIPPEAATQGGRFTYADALRDGTTKAVFDTARRSAEILRLRHNVYCEASLFAELAAVEQHRFDVQVQQLARGAGWHAARRSAAVLWDLPLIGSPPVVPQLVADPAGTKSQGRDRHCRVASLPLVDRAQIDGQPVVSMARAVADIARAEPMRNAVVVADAVLGTGVNKAELERCLGRMTRWPGVIAARRAVAFADGLAETPLESLSRVSVHQLDLPAPELQVEVWYEDQLIGRVDQLWRATRTVGEPDGLGKYGTDEATVRRTLAAEKVREDWLKDVGFEVPRWTWDDAWRPQNGVLDGRLRRAFARGQTRQLDPRVRLVPTTVADRLRREGRLPHAWWPAGSSVPTSLPLVRPTSLHGRRPYPCR